MAPAAAGHGLTLGLNAWRKETAAELSRKSLQETGGHAVCFYFLMEPVEDIVRYIGKAQDIGSRYSQHILNAHKSSSPCAKWVQGVIDSGRLPRVELVGSVQAFGMANTLAWRERASLEVERLLVQTIASTSHRLFSGYEFDLLNVEHTR